MSSHLNLTNFFSSTTFDAGLIGEIYADLPDNMKAPGAKAAFDANVALVKAYSEQYAQTQKVDDGYYHAILGGFENAITVFRATLPADQQNSWRMLPTLIRNVADLSRWVKDYKTTVEYDRKDLELAKANPDTYDTWLSISLSTLAGDLFNLGGKDELVEGEGLVRQSLAEAFRILPDASEHNIVRAEIGGIYGELIHNLIKQEQWDKAHDEMVKLVAFAKDCVDNDFLSPLMDWNYYLMALQIASHFVPTDAFDDQFDKAVALGKEAVAMLPAMLDAQPNFMPKGLLQVFELIGGHKELAEYHEPRKKNRKALLDPAKAKSGTAAPAAAAAAAAPAVIS
jgi:hypothetical protein